MENQTNGAAERAPAERARKRRRVLVVSSDGTFAESLRSHLAGEFDVLLAKNAGEAAAKAQAVQIDLALGDLGSPILGMPALGRMRGGVPRPVVFALAVPESPPAQSQFDFAYVIARPQPGADVPDRVRFILAKAERGKRR